MRVAADQRRQQIIEAAVTVMTRDGFARATTRAIAEEAGAPLAAIHYCFRDKDEIVRGVIEHAAARVQKEAMELRKKARSRSGVRELAESAASSWWRKLERLPEWELAQFEFILWALRQEGHGDLANLSYRRYIEILADLFSSAAADAGESLAVTPWTLARGFVVIIDGITFQYLADRKRRRTHRETYSLLIDALLAKAGV